MKSSQNKKDLDRRVRLELIRTFFNNARGNSVLLAGGGVLFVGLLDQEGVSGILFLPWLGLLWLLCASVFLFERKVARVGITADNATRLYRIRIGLGAAVAAVFGATIVFLADESTARTTFALVFVVTTSVVAASYMAYVTAFAYCLLVNALGVLPFALFCLYRARTGDDAFYLWLAGASILWQTFFITKAYRVCRSMVEGIALRIRMDHESAERRLSEIALRQSEEASQQLAAKLRLMCDNVPDMIWAKDLSGAYTFVNKAFCEKLLNVSDTGEPIGKTFDYFAERERLSRPDQPEWYTFGLYSKDVDTYTLAHAEPTVFEESGTVRGSFVFLDIHQARLFNVQGDVVGIVGCARDITERKASEQFVHHLAYHDVLTDLPNRILLHDRLRQGIALAKRDRGRLAVLFIDLDRLKQVNDTLGHDIGDLLLKNVATRLREVASRQTDTVSRLGGDEFVVLLPRINKEEDVVLVAEKILAALNRTFSVCGNAIDISASIGIAFHPKHGDDAVLLLKRADAAMYEAKRSGRNAFRIFDSVMESRSD